MMKNWNIEKLNDRPATNTRQTMKTRNGKIARLPHHVREELNVRLERSERSPQLLAWLNALPEVREFVQREFGGEPVSKHNLSQWRLGGFQDWLTRRDFFADARNADDFVSERQKGAKRCWPTRRPRSWPRVMRA